MGRFIAYDARGGKKLWEFHAQTGIIAAPVTTRSDGEHTSRCWRLGRPLRPMRGRIVMQAAKGGFNRILTFKLGAKAELPARDDRAQLDPPTASAAPQSSRPGSGCTRPTA